MAALTPPLNAAGVPLPPIPGNPSLLGDISNAKNYVDQLAASKFAGYPNGATDIEIGAGEAYKAAVIFSHSPGRDAAPAWLTNLTATVNQIAGQVANLTVAVDQIAGQVSNLTVAVDQIAGDVMHLRQKANELPILLANSQAGAEAETNSLGLP